MCKIERERELSLLTGDGVRDYAPRRTEIECMFFTCVSVRERVCVCILIRWERFRVVCVMSCGWLLIVCVYLVNKLKFEIR